MPTYEYICSKCAKKFSLTMTITEHDRKKAKCPKCKSSRVKQKFGAFFPVTSDKS
jgi:putative FmdB family regulatory protein